MRKKVMRLWAAILCASMILGSVDVPASVALASENTVNAVEEATEIVVNVEESTSAESEAVQESMAEEASSSEAVSEEQTGEVASSEDESVSETSTVSTEAADEESSEAESETTTEIENKVEETTTCETTVEETTEVETQTTEVSEEESTEPETSEEGRDVEKTDLEEPEEFVCSGDHEMAPELLNNMQLLNAKLNGGKSKDPVDNTSSMIQGNGLMPSTGDVKSLVIMVDFADATFADSVTEEGISDLFFGEEDVDSAVYPRESLSAWYKRSSYGKLNVTGEVVSITLDNNKSYYEVSDDNPDGQTNLLNEVWQKVGDLDLTWTDYDSDSDLYVDAPCLVVAGTSGAWASQWWSNASSSEYEMECGYKPGHFVMCMEDSISSDASTAIHEYGHILGLPDLYATSSGSFSQIGCGIATWDMMATNTGDFNGFCKMLLGWIDAEDIKTIQGTSDLQEVSLQPYAETGELAVLYADLENTSLFSEYFLVQYLDPDKNNDTGSEQFAHNSLRIYHVNAELGDNNYFKYSNSGDGLWLIRYVDKDRYEVHGEHDFYLSTYDGTSEGDVYKVETYYNASYTDTDCEYTTGDVFTPYTTPSTASYPSNSVWSDPYEYTGLHMEEIVVNDVNATFQAYYEEEPQDASLEFRSAVSNEISVQGANKIIISNREIWQNDSTITAYMRKKGETEKSADVTIDLMTVHNENESNAFRNLFYAFKVSIDSTSILERGTTYEMVFPAGMFIDSLGKISEEVIVEFQTEGDYWETDIKEFEFDPSIYHSVSKTFALTTEGNIAVICEKVSGEVYLCIINPDTNQMIKEVPVTYNGNVITGELRTESGYGYALTNVEDFGCTEKGTYWMTFCNPWDNINDRTVKLYIFDENGDVKECFLPETVDSIFLNKQIVTMPYDGTYTGVYYDIDNLKRYIGDKGTIFDNSYVLDDNRIFTGGNILTGISYYGVYALEEEGMVNEKVTYLPQYTPKAVMKKETGYSLIVDEKIPSDAPARTERSTWQIETDENFILKSAKKIFDGKGIINAEKIEGGYLLVISDPSVIGKGIPTLYDENFNKLGELSGIDRYDGNVRLIGTEGEYNYFVDYNATDIVANQTNFLYRVSKPIEITNEEESVEEITLSEDIVFDENNKVIVNSNTFDVDIEAFLETIEPVAGETYDLIPFDEKYNSEEYYLVVTNAEGTYRQYYQTVIKGAMLLDTTKIVDDFEFQVIMKKYSDAVQYIVNVTNKGETTKETSFYQIKFVDETGSVVSATAVEVPVIEKDQKICVENVRNRYSQDIAVDNISDCIVEKRNITFISDIKEFGNLQFSNLKIETVENGTRIYVNVKNCGEAITDNLYVKLNLKDNEDIVIGSIDLIVNPIGETESHELIAFTFETFEGITDYEVVDNSNIVSIGGEKYFNEFEFTELIIEKADTGIEFTLDFKNCGEATSESYFLTLYLKDIQGNIVGSGPMCIPSCAENESMDVVGGITGTCEGVVDYEIRLADEKYIVTLDSQEATEAGTESVSVAYGSDMPEITIPQKEGYQFRGYFSEPNGQGTQYYDNTGSGVIKFNKIDAVTLYAYWIEADVQITALPTANITSGNEVQSGTEIILTTETESASIYYTLDGTDPTTESTLYTAPIVLTADTTIKAIAVKEGYQNSEVATFAYTVAAPEKVFYTVSFNSTGGSEVASQTVEENGTVEKPADPTREGYIFKGWYLDGEAYDFATLVTGNITLEAKWEIDESKDPGDVSEEDMPEGGIAAIPEGLWIAGVDENGYTYTGKAIKPEARVYDHKTLLTVKKDYTISYRNNTKAADASAEKAPTITVKGKGNYSGTDTKTFAILKKNLQDSDIKVSDVTVKYNSKAQKPVPVVTWNGKKLTNKKDFTVSYPDLTAENTDAYKKTGTYRIEITGKTNYTGTVTAYVIITENTLMSAVKVAKIKSQPYTGGEIKPALSVSYKGDPLTEGEDYTVTYVDNVKIGTATAVLTGKGSFAGEKKVTFKITGDSLKKADIEVIVPTEPYVYTGSEIRPELNVTFVKDGKKIKLEENRNYTAVYAKNITPGTASITLTGINDFTGTVKKTFKIKAYDIDADKEKKISVTMPDEIFYEKGGSKPKPVVAFGGTILTEGRDYTLSYKKNTALNNGLDVTKMPTVTIKGKGNFTKSITEKFCIAQRDISEVKISVPDKIYNSKKNGFKSTPVLTDTNGKKLKVNTDYQKDYMYTYAEETTTEDGVIHQAGDRIADKDVLKVGTLVNVSVKGRNCYTSQWITGQYRIIKADIAKAKVTVKPQDYTGKAVTLTKDDITVKCNGEEVDKSNFIIVGYENNIRKGTAKVTIKGVGDTYGGTKTVKFKIKAKGFVWWKR